MHSAGRERCHWGLGGGSICAKIAQRPANLLSLLNCSRWTTLQCCSDEVFMFPLTFMEVLRRSVLEMKIAAFIFLFNATKVK